MAMAEEFNNMLDHEKNKNLRRWTQKIVASERDADIENVAMHMLEIAYMRGYEQAMMEQLFKEACQTKT